MPEAIGIDLGTTYSCVAVYQNEKVEIIANNEGNRTTPSCVSFDDVGRLIGDAALNQMSGNPMNTVYDAKRMFGKKFTDPTVTEDMKHWPFKVVSSKDGAPRIEVTNKKVVKTFAPEEISSMVLMKMRSAASAFLGKKVKDAVITVPAYFNDSQRQATKDAGEIAGLNVLRIISEPTAAALAYGLQKKSNEKRNVLVFDLGGGTFDVSILVIENGTFDVKSTAGDTHLGGEDFNTRLVNHFAAEFQKKTSKDLMSNARSLCRLRTACEKVKRTLSTSTQATIVVENLLDGVDFNCNISRARFEDLCSDLFKKTLDLVDSALSDSGLLKNQIDDVVLVGGSTRIPKVQKMLTEYFDGKTLNTSINPDEAVAYGAAVQAAILSGQENLQNVVLLDVTPLSLGTEIEDGSLCVIIKRNTRIPAKLTKRFITCFDNQTKMDIGVYEGEFTMAEDNNLLGSFVLTGITPLPKGEAKIVDIYDLDVNGILTVTSEEKLSGSSKTLVIEKRRNFNREEIARMIGDAEKFRLEDEARLAKLKADEAARLALEKCALELIRDVEQNVYFKKMSEILKTCQDVVHFVNSNKTAEKADHEKWLKKIHAVSLPVTVPIFAATIPQEL